ncbi:MAG: PQQ-binding-like beta-propeller repeat protein, partial [Candidatus Competibacteraceae bacterium]
VVYVHGEPGVGKTRLIYELQRQAQSPLAWFTCPADPILRQSLNPFRYFLRQYFGQNSDDTEEINKINFAAALNTLIERLRTETDASGVQGVIAELERTRSMLGALVDLYWEGSLYEQLEPELRFRNTLLAFKMLVQAESRLQPVILHVEDVHWLDPDSQELLVTLTRNVHDAPFAVILSGRYRDDGSPFTLELDADVPRATLDLNTLSLEGTRALAAQVLAGPLSDVLANFLSLKTEGNPLFVEQLTLDLRERALVRRDNHAWDIVSRDVEKIIAPPRGRTEIERLIDIHSEPKAFGDTLYLAAYRGSVAAIDMRGGNLLWNRDVSSYAGLDVDDRQVYVSDDTDAVLALDRRNGGTLWKQPELTGRRLSAPAVSGNHVVVGDFEGYLHWLSPDSGRIVGRTRAASKAIVAPPLAVGDIVFVQDQGGTLGAFRAGG